MRNKVQGGLKIIVLALAGMAAPLTALAESVTIRVEARRGAEAQAAAQAWAAQFPEVVTFPLPGGWTGIALGPMERDAADDLMAQLKAERRIPPDSFIAVPEAALMPVAPGGAAPAGADAAGGDAAIAGAADAAATDPATPAPVPGTSPETTSPTADVAPDTAPTGPAAEPAPAPPPEHFIRLQSLRTREEADAALADWRETFPEAGLSRRPDDWFAVTLGPMEEPVAAAWLTAFRNAGRVPKDAFVTTAADLGTVVDAGAAPDLPGPGTAEMPPLDDVQRALRWAGRYDGEIDGKDGPRTREAIAAQVVADRAAPDAGTAMRRLMERREAWRVQMGLSELRDDHTGLQAIAPMDRLEFDRTQRALSIYRPKGDSGAALILFSQPGGQQEMLDLAGLVTALGWVPRPERDVSQGRITLDGRNATHIGHAEGRVADGRAEGFVLIWPVEDGENQPRVAAEIADSLTRFAPAATDAGEDAAALPGTEADTGETPGPAPAN